MIFPGEVQYHQIDKSALSRSTTYEIRLSYLGFDAAAFKIEWEPCNTKKSFRALLDTDKLVFSTDEEKNIEGNICDNYVISIKATRNSRAINKAAEDREIYYNLAFEKYGKHIPLPESGIMAAVLIMTFVPCSILVYISFGFSSRDKAEKANNQ